MAIVLFTVKTDKHSQLVEPVLRQCPTVVLYLSPRQNQFVTKKIDNNLVGMHMFFWANQNGTLTTPLTPINREHMRVESQLVLQHSECVANVSNLALRQSPAATLSFSAVVQRKRDRKRERERNKQSKEEK